MKCRKGDIAIVIRDGHEANVGIMCDVEEPEVCACGKPSWNMTSLGREFVDDVFGLIRVSSMSVVCHDADLQPIRGDVRTDELDHAEPKIVERETEPA